MFERWNFTVCSVTHSLRAISLFVEPAATSRSTSSSRADSTDSSAAADFPSDPWTGPTGL